MTVPKLRFKEFDGDWSFSKIGEIFKVTSGATPLRSDNRFFENANIPWVKTTDLNNSFISNTEEKISEIALKETSVKILPKGTVFVAMYGGFNQIGRTGLLLNESACNQALSAIYPNEKVDAFFLLTYLNHKVDDWKNFAASSRKDPNITKSDVLAFPLVYPSKEEQTKIASFLSTVDEKIDQLTQKHQLLSQYKQGMMQKLFSQQIRFKADDGSEFGEWVKKTIGEIGEVITGKTPSTNNPNAWNGDILFVTPTDMNGNKYQTTTIRTVANSHPKILPQNAIMFTCIASIGKMSLSVKPCITNQQINSVVVKKDQPEFIYYQLLSMVDYIKSTQANTTLPIINKTEFSKFILKIPQYAEQTKIANFLSAIDQKIEVVAQQIEQAKTWKKGLLQQMFI